MLEHDEVFVERGQVLLQRWQLQVGFLLVLLNILVVEGGPVLPVRVVLTVATSATRLLLLSEHFLLFLPVIVEPVLD